MASPTPLVGRRTVREAQRRRLCHTRRIRFRRAIRRAARPAQASRGPWMTSVDGSRAAVGRSLRRLGWTCGEIMELLPVPKGTLAGWCQGVRLTPAQALDIRERTVARPGVSDPPSGGAWIGSRASATRPEPASDRSSENRCGLLGSFCTGVREADGLSTPGGGADARALQVFRAWCEGYHDSDADFSAAVSLHDDNDVGTALRWWARQARPRHGAVHEAVPEACGDGPPNEYAASRRLSADDATEAPTPSTAPWRGSRSYPSICSARCPLTCRRVASSIWQSIRLLTGRFRVRVPGDPRTEGRTLAACLSTADAAEPATGNDLAVLKAETQTELRAIGTDLGTVISP